MVFCWSYDAKLDMTEHRREARRRLRFPVTVGRSTLFTASISRGGFSTEALRVLGPGVAVEGVIRARGNEYAYSGKVIWARSGDPRMNVRGRMGIRFTSVAPELASLLDSLPLPESTAPRSVTNPGRTGKP
jgi:hypothetical protein